MVRLPPQSPSRYIPPALVASGSPVSGCPRSLQVATFPFERGELRLGVRLPPQSPSRYIRRSSGPTRRARPVAPAVSKSLHSPRTWMEGSRVSGCPRSLQVATFCVARRRSASRVRLPPQSPSRYIPPAAPCSAPPGPVAPAVSKSLHSGASSGSRRCGSGCPRSLQVATFSRPAGPAGTAVRLPPQSPSRYIPARSPRPRADGPVAPAVSKSLHSAGAGAARASTSGCPRSLQVATFLSVSVSRPPMVRLPPQSPSRYIRRDAAPGM